MRSLRLAILMVTGCAASTPDVRSGEEILARGGALASTEIPEATVRIIGDHIEAWGMTEVPGSSRRQAAFALIDALTRAELLKAIQVSVTSLAVDVQTGEATRLSQSSSEAVSGVLTRAEPIEHGWLTLRRDGQVILRIIARLRVPAAMVCEALTPVLGGGEKGEGQARRAIRELATP